MKDTKGFTLIEISIALVVIAFLMAAVIQGQKMISNARMQKLVADMRNYAQAFLIYYERYGMYPGDENDTGFPASDSYNGNHNGLVESGNEADNAWQDLAGTLGMNKKGSPIHGGIYSFGSRSFFGSGSQNFIAVSSLPNNIAQNLDSKHDDGASNTGNIRSSAAYNGSETLVSLFWRI